MRISVKKYDHVQHQDLCEITLVNDHNMQVKLLNYGATLEQVLLPLKGQLTNVIMSLPTPADYSKARNFLGGTVGRIVGRLRAGKWQLGEKVVQLPLNDGDNHIHGGNGTDTQVFDFATRYHQDSVEAKFILVDPDGANGYPGNLKLQVKYLLDNDNQLHYETHAISDKLTIFNPTNHVYFRLDGPQSTVEKLKLQINSDYYLPLDKDSIPYQGRREVRRTVFDFRQPKQIGEVLNANDSEIKAEHGLNHPFILTGKQPAAILQSADDQVSMTMTTKSPSVVVYTGNHFNHTGVAKSLGQYDGVTLEAQFPPAEANDLTAITLMPNEKFKTWTNWRFEF